MGGPEGFVAGALPGRLPSTVAVLAHQDDRSGLAIDDCLVAATHVIGSVRRHASDFFILGALVKQIGQDRTFTVTAGGKLHGADV